MHNFGKVPAKVRWIARIRGRVIGPVVARTEEHARAEFASIYGVNVAPGASWRECDGLPKEAKP